MKSRENPVGTVGGWSYIRTSVKMLALAAALVLPLLVTTTVAQAPTYSVIFTFSTGFSGPDGAEPAAGLIRDGAGNLYGTTSIGGGSSCNPFGCGVVLKLDPSGNETVLHTFTGGSDGSQPTGPLIRDALGNLYGTTATGGTGPCNIYTYFPGCGTVFKLDPQGNETILYTFQGAPDGAIPFAGLTQDPAGNLYGTTEVGGDLVPACGSPTSFGCGVVFQLNPAGKETILHAFTAGSDGAIPFSGLTRDADSNLYGTTSGGGGPGCFALFGCGVVFKLDPTGQETILHSFSRTDGYGPYYGYLVRDAGGNLYGTTASGGSGTSCGYKFGCGVVFKLDPSGNETVLHSFSGGSDGYDPGAGVVRDAAGNLYGTAVEGGIKQANSGFGTIFEISPSGKTTVLYAFTGGADGRGPSSQLLPYQSFLYGTAGGGGGAGGTASGVVFKITPH